MGRLETQMKKYHIINRLLFVQNNMNSLLWLYWIRDSSDKTDNDARSTNRFVLVCTSPSQSDIFGEYFVVVLSFFKLCEIVNCSLFILIGVMIKISKYDQQLSRREFLKFLVGRRCSIITTNNNRELGTWNMRKIFFIFLQLVLFGSPPVRSKAVLQVTKSNFPLQSLTHFMTFYMMTTSRIMATLICWWGFPRMSPNLLRCSRSWSSFWQKPVQVSTEQPGLKFVGFIRFSIFPISLFIIEPCVKTEKNIS